MINIGPLSYNNLLNNSEIISEIIQYKVNVLNGKTLFETSAKLNENLRPKDIFQSKIYSNFDGSGTSFFRNNSLYKAVSEAVERWAFYDSSEGDEYLKLKFDVNPSTCGMASYPELFPYWSRKNAVYEAVERYAIHAFNRKKIPVVELQSNIVGLKVYKLITTIKDMETILISYFNGSFYTYGFSCKKTQEESIDHALIELARNERVLKKLYLSSFDILDMEISDRRLIFFSTVEGYQSFLQKIETAPSKVQEIPKLILSREIKGPWTRYAKVWRHLYDDSYDLNQSDVNYFMF